MIIWPTFKSKWWTKIIEGSFRVYHWHLSVIYHTSGYLVSYHCVKTDSSHVWKWFKKRDDMTWDTLYTSFGWSKQQYSTTIIISPVNTIISMIYFTDHRGFIEILNPYVFLINTTPTDLFARHWEEWEVWAEKTHLHWAGWVERKDLANVRV